MQVQLSQFQSKVTKPVLVSHRERPLGVRLGKRPMQDSPDSGCDKGLGLLS